jgi:hypothetical protein
MAGGRPQNSAVHPGPIAIPSNPLSFGNMVNVERFNGGVGKIDNLGGFKTASCLILLYLRLSPTYCLTLDNDLVDGQIGGSKRTALPR